MEAADSANECRARTARHRAQIPAFGHWDLDRDQIPITQYFECCARSPPPYSTAARSSVYPYAAYPHSAYIGDGLINMFAAEGEFHGLFNAGGRRQQLDYPNMKTSVGEVTGQFGTRRQRRRRLYSDTSKKVFDATTDSCYDPNDAGISHDLYDVVSPDNFQLIGPGNRKTKTTVRAMDEDLYKIPPELIHSTKRKKMRRFFRKCFATICASY